MSDGHLRMEIEIVFLAMSWGGGGPYTIAEIIGVYDRINRAIPDRIEMQTAFNTLPGMGLIEKRGERFLIPKAQMSAFEAFKKKRHRNKFDLVSRYFRQLPKTTDPAAVVEFTEDEYKAHVHENADAFR